MMEWPSYAQSPHPSPCARRCRRACRHRDEEYSQENEGIPDDSEFSRVCAPLQIRGLGPGSSRRQSRRSALLAPEEGDRGGSGRGGSRRALLRGASAHLSSGRRGGVGGSSGHHGGSNSTNVSKDTFSFNCGVASAVAHEWDGFYGKTVPCWYAVSAAGGEPLPGYPLAMTLEDEPQQYGDCLKGARTRALGWGAVLARPSHAFPHDG